MLKSVLSNPWPYTIVEFGLVSILAGHEKPKSAALTVLSLLYNFGAINRRLPTGGSANGTPRYSETPGFQDEACPLIEPLDVLTVSPTDQVCAAVRLARKVIDTESHILDIKEQETEETIEQLIRTRTLESLYKNAVRPLNPFVRIAVYYDGLFRERNFRQ
jgi:hypothetical protein